MSKVMKKGLILLLVSIFLGLPSFFGVTVKAQEDETKKDTQIEVKTDRLFTIEGKDFDPKDCFVTQNDFKGRVMAITDGSDIKKQGKHNIHFVIFSENGNVTFEDVEVVTLSQKEYDDAFKYISSDTGSAYEANKNLADLKGDGTKTKAYELAQKYIGMGGTCLQVAYAFTKEYQGERFKNFDVYRDVTLLEAAPGDIIYYANGGLGYEHWAVYLGGNLALQGNFLGGTIIGNVYLNNASEPQFRRLY